MVASHSDCLIVGRGQIVLRSTGERFIATVTESGSQHTQCNFDVISLEINRSEIKATRRSGPIRSPGRFKRFVVSVPPSLAGAATQVVEHGQLILDAGYQWVADKILELAESQEIRVGEGLYSLCREIFPEIEFRREIWFATVGPLYGFRLIAPEVVDGALEVYSSAAKDLPVSALDLLAQLIATCLPRELLLMDKAARRGGIMDVNISDAGYARDPYAFVMSGLYKSTAFTIYPILRRREDDLAVMALFPTHRVAILSRFDAYVEDFRERAVNLAAAITEASSLFEVAETIPDLPNTDTRKMNVAHRLARAVDEARIESDKQRYTKSHRLKFIGRVRAPRPK